MNSTFFVGWKGFYGSVLVTVIMFFCFLGVSSSQEDSLDQVTIEQTLMNALPMQADLAPGMPWEYYDGPLFRWISGDLCYATASWDADIKPNNYIINYFASAICQYQRESRSEDEFRLLNLRSSTGVKNEVYDGLPGGVISYQAEANAWTAIFWSSEHYWGSVQVYFNENNRYKDRESDANAFARSECERLAKLVYSRLPGSDVAQPLVQSPALPSASSSESLAPKQAAQDDLGYAKAIRDGFKPTRLEQAVYLCKIIGAPCSGIERALNQEQGTSIMNYEYADPLSLENKMRDHAQWTRIMVMMEEAQREERYDEVHEIYKNGYDDYSRFYYKTPAEQATKHNTEEEKNQAIQLHRLTRQFRGMPIEE